MATWRQMTSDDVQSVIRVADLVHPSLPESAGVFQERVKLFPAGCMVLEEDGHQQICGYAISHPIRRHHPPALDNFLGSISPEADQYYIHDVAVLDSFRGRGLADQVVRQLLGVAESLRYETTCLISVYGTSFFWGRFGFVPVSMNEDMVKKLREYGTDAVYLMRTDLSCLNKGSQAIKPASNHRDAS
ncbi:hypothetical protein S40288_10632 [Stachybotrys chartarum IBT 40288]|nr:hypothetical protein S40288_10632 [Stachybotrys chartarum IBT 40288]